MTTPLAAPAPVPDLDTAEHLAAYIATFASPAHYLIGRGAAYAIPVEGTDWYEVDSVSDGMCGSVTFENPWTTERQSLHWTVDEPACSSEGDARMVAAETFRREALELPSWTMRPRDNAVGRMNSTEGVRLNPSEPRPIRPAALARALLAELRAAAEAHDEALRREIGQEMLVGYIPPSRYGQCSAHGRVLLGNVRDWPDFGVEIGECPRCGSTLAVEGSEGSAT